MSEAKQMRALIFDGPWSLSVQQRPAPKPGSGEALIRTIATGICGSDLHGFTGENGRRRPGQIMGHETVGELISIDGDPDGAEAGSVVTFNPVIGCGACPACQQGQTHHCRTRRVVGVEPEIPAAMAELVTVPAANVVPLPSGTLPELGALVEPLAVGWHAVRRGGIDRTASVLVQGAGAIGQAVALAAQRAGAATITVSEPNPARRRTVTRLGFTTVDPAASPEGIIGDSPYDIVIDAVGSPDTVNAGLANLAVGGRLVLVGMHAPRVDLDAYAVSTLERSIIGSYCYSPQDFSSTAGWVGEQGDELLPLIGGRIGLDQAPGVFAELATGHREASKILIMMQRESADG